MKSIILCADEHCQRYPDAMGLEGENLENISWLTLFSSAHALRAYAKSCTEPTEIWVVSADDMDAINVAAAIKRDVPQLEVYLITSESSGSILSRAASAGLNGTFTQAVFLQRFTAEKRLRQKMKNETFTNFSSQATQVLPVVASDSAPVPATQLAQKKSRSAFILTVVSGSGGAGKSATAAVAAFLAQAKGFRTLLLDCDLQFGDVHFFKEGGAAVTSKDILDDPGRVVLLAPTADAPAILAAPQRLEQAELFTGRLGYLLDLLDMHFDVIVVNTGSNWSEFHAQLLERSTTSLFLIDQRASSVRACKHALELCTRCGIASGSFVYAVNRCDRRSFFTSLDVSCALGGAHVRELKEGGPEVEELLGAGMIGKLIASRNEFCRSVEDMLDDILPDLSSKSGLTLSEQDRKTYFSERRPSVKGDRLRAKKRSSKKDSAQRARRGADASMSMMSGDTMALFEGNRL